MKKVCVFLFLLFDCSESMNISCLNSTYSENNTVFYEMCNISAPVNDNLEVVCNVSKYAVKCVSAACSGQTSVLQYVFNAGSIIGWVWFGIRGVYKCFRSSPREDYMRGRFQRVLSSELLGFLITLPSIISIATDASWGNYLINAGPLLFGAIIQLPYDIFKILRSCRKEQRLDLFEAFMTKLEGDITLWNELAGQRLGTLSDNEQKKLLKTKKELESRLDIRLLEWACEEFSEIRINYNLAEDVIARYRVTIFRFCTFFSDRLEAINESVSPSGNQE